MKIKSPAQGYSGTAVFGETVLEFEDGVADFDGDLPPGVRQYLAGAGYGIDSDPTEPESAPEPPDPRDLPGSDLGTRLRDAAVDPRPEDFLPPTNAGEANPHGPEVVAPGIHAVSGPGPIVPGPVGRFEEVTDDDGNVTSQVVISDTEEQQRRETTAAERVFLGQEPVPDVTADLGRDVGQPPPTAEQIAADKADAAEQTTSTAGGDGDGRPAGNASTDEWRAYAIGQGMDEDEANSLGRDELRDRYTS